MSLENNNSKQEKSRLAIRRVTYGGILAAVIMIATMVFQFPIPMPALKGYVNFGDGVIMAAAMIMGPYAAISAAIGSALADLLSPYVIFAPATFLIKGSMGLVAGTLFRRYPKMNWVGAVGVMAICEAIMVSGYYLFELFYYALTHAPISLRQGAMTAAIAIPYNLVQAVAAVLLGLAMMPVAKRLMIDKPDLADSRDP